MEFASEGLSVTASSSTSEGLRIIFVRQRAEITEQNLLVVPVGIKLDYGSGRAHLRDGDRIVLTVLKTIHVIQSIDWADSTGSTKSNVVESKHVCIDIICLQLSWSQFENKFCNRAGPHAHTCTCSADLYRLNTEQSDQGLHTRSFLSLRIKVK